MNRDLLTALALAAAALLAQLQPAPAPPRPADRVMGVVNAVTPENKEVSIRTDAGEVYGAVADAGAQVLRIAAGERDMSKAGTIAFADIAVGDRLLIRGEISAARRTVLANTFMVMSRASIPARQSKEREDWKRGASRAW